jgi:hypothetical protein
MLVYSGERNHVHIILLLFMSGLLTLMVLIKSVMKVPKYFVLGSQNRSLGYSQLLGLVLRWRTLPEIPSDGWNLVVTFSSANHVSISQGITSVRIIPHIIASPASTPRYISVQFLSLQPSEPIACPFSTHHLSPVWFHNPSRLAESMEDVFKPCLQFY